MTDDKPGTGDRLAALFTLLNRVGAVLNGLNGIVESRAAQVAAFEMRAVRRAAGVFALALAAALLACAAAGFAAFAIHL